VTTTSKNSEGKPMSFNFLLNRNVIFLTAILVLPSWAQVYAQSNSSTYDNVTYHNGEFTLKGRLCKPSGAGPFPAVIYNHGGVGSRIGGDPVETCMELARDGYVGFSPMRRQTRSLDGHLRDVLSALDYVKNLDSVDKNRIGMIGFSRGALLTLMAGIHQSNLKALIIMAPAPGRGALDRSLKKVGKITAPVLLLVAKNDNKRADHVQLSRKVKRALDSANKRSKLIVYPPYKRDGHRMFFLVGDYWRDVQDFLSENL